MRIEKATKLPEGAACANQFRLGDCLRMVRCTDKGRNCVDKYYIYAGTLGLINLEDGCNRGADCKDTLYVKVDAKVVIE